MLVLKFEAFLAQIANPNKIAALYMKIRTPTPKIRYFKRQSLSVISKPIVPINLKAFVTSPNSQSCVSVDITFQTYRTISSAFSYPIKGSQNNLAQLDIGQLWQIFALKIRSFSEIEFNTFIARMAEQYSLQITQDNDSPSFGFGWSSEIVFPASCFNTILSIFPNFLKNSSMSAWLKLKLSGMEILSMPTDSLQCFSNLQIMRYTAPLFQTSALLSSLKRSSGLSTELSDSDDELLLSESSLLLRDELFLLIQCYYQITNKLLLIFISRLMNNKEEEIDPSIYQYDQVYDQIKGNERNKQKSRSRSREKEKKKEERPKHPKYIGKMKQIASEREKTHELAHEKKIRKENERMGVNEEMVFVTQSYLKKKQQEKQAAQKKKQEQQRNAKQQVENGDYLDFKKKMLEQTCNLTKK